jgi:hypothetical protein
LFRTFILEIRKKRQCFEEKTDWEYKCKASYVTKNIATKNLNEDICGGFSIFIQWSQKQKKNHTENIPQAFEVLYFLLPPTKIHDDVLSESISNRLKLENSQ